MSKMTRNMSFWAKTFMCQSDIAIDFTLYDKSNIGKNFPLLTDQSENGMKRLKTTYLVNFVKNSQQDIILGKMMS